MNLGVLGGSFDPVHRGHLAVARAALASAGLDRVLFMVAGAPPHKLGRTLAPGDERLHMVRLALQGEPSFQADDRELRRPGPSFTVQTVRELLAEAPPGLGVSWIIGADTLPDLPSWREIDDLLDLAGVLTAVRAGQDLEAAFRALASRLRPTHVEALRRNVVAMPPVDVSSTEVRRRARQGLPLAGLVPEEVEAHIVAKGLYR